MIGVLVFFRGSAMGAYVADSESEAHAYLCGVRAAFRAALVNGHYDRAHAYLHPADREYMGEREAPEQILEALRMFEYEADCKRRGL